MPRTSELTERIDELFAKQETSDEDLEEIAQFESDERLMPLDNFNLGQFFTEEKSTLKRLIALAMR